MDSFLDESFICFTSDIDWAGEEQIEFTLDLFDEYGVPVTPFITHPSKTVEKRFSDKRNLVGLHPNFHRGSSQGDSYEEVVDNVRHVWPEAVFFRSHSYFDNTHITRLFSKAGFKFDANLFLFLQNSLVPLRPDSGMLRFPTSWEDDVHLLKKLPLRIEPLMSFLKAPGLKILNFHPVHVYFNIPDLDFYSAIKRGKTACYDGSGMRTLLTALLGWMRDEGFRAFTLPELYKISIEHDTKKPTPSKDLNRYVEASTEKRAERLKALYNSLETTKTYATSRDFNLRELEIAFIRSHLDGCQTILDIGCGNGYTLLSLAKTMTAEMRGIDFSEEMVKGAKLMAERMVGPNFRSPKFEVGDVTKMEYPDESFDAVISERCLLNLPTREDQFATLREIHRVLKRRGKAVLVEGTLQGLNALNTLRTSVGLPAIPDRSEGNFSSLKFDEIELENQVRGSFDVELKQDFGTYYLISRVVHPLLVLPEEPKFDAKINAVARRVATVTPSYSGLGHVVGYVLRKL